MNTIKLTWKDIYVATKLLIMKLAYYGRFDLVLGIENGGIIPSLIVATELGWNWDSFRVSHYAGRERKPYVEMDEDKLKSFIGKNISDILIIDDVYDTGDTAREVLDFMRTNKKFGFRFGVVYSKGEPREEVVYGRIVDKDSWLIFPWEEDR